MFFSIMTFAEYVFLRYRQYDQRSASFIFFLCIRANRYACIPVSFVTGSSCSKDTSVSIWRSPSLDTFTCSVSPSVICTRCEAYVSVRVGACASVLMYPCLHERNCPVRRSVHTKGNSGRLFDSLLLPCHGTSSDDTPGVPGSGVDFDISVG